MHPPQTNTRVGKDRGVNDTNQHQIKVRLLIIKYNCAQIAMNYLDIIMITLLPIV